MAMIQFLRGTQAGLAAKETINGALYFTTDTHKIYMGTETGKQEFSAIEVVSAVSALPSVATAIKGKFYYAEAQNVFCFPYNGEWKQVNPDTGATSIEVVDGGGNAISAASYDASTRKITLTKGETFATPLVVDSKISDKVGELKIGETAYDTVKAYVDEKTSGIASESALTELSGRVTTAEGKITALENANKEGGAVANAIADAKKAGTDAQSALNTYKTTNDAAVKANTDAISAINNETTGILAQAKTYADGKDAAISAAKAAADAAQADVDALETKVGAVPDGNNVVKMIGDVDAAYKAADTALAGRISTIEGDYLKAADKTALETAIGKKVDKTTYDAKVSALETADANLQTNINNEAKAREDADKAQVTRIANLETKITGLSGAMHFEGVKAELPADGTGYEAGDVIIVGEKEYVFNGTEFVEFGDVSAEGDRITALEGTVGKAAEGDSPATGLIKDIADNAAAIAAEKKRAETAEKANSDAISALETSVSGTYETKADATSKLTEAKNYADGLNTAMGARVDALEAIDHSAYALKTDVASSQSAQDTKIDANTAAIATLNGADTVDGSVAKKIKDAIAAENLSQYATDTELTALDIRVQAVEGTSHTHANKDELDKIASGDKAKWDAVVADHLVAADKTKLEKAIALKANSADVYTKTETYTQAQVDALLTWVEF